MLAAFLSRLESTVDGEWRLGIGDPTLVGWLTVVAYFAAAFACYRRFRDAHRYARLRWNQPTSGWLTLTVLLALLGINKQLDLQTWLTATARAMAVDQGWYEVRRIVQVIFIVGISAVGLVATIVAVVLARGPWRALRASLVGFVLIASYVAVRAASFHRVDMVIGYEVLGTRLNWVFELGGIACVLFGTRRSAPPSRG